VEPQEFAAKWRASTLGERQGYQAHFNDLCELVGHPRPTDPGIDPTTFMFEKPVTKFSGAAGAADVWYERHFAVEYKGKGGDLDKAYGQLLQYRDNLGNPPLLITCDFERLIIRTNYTGLVTRVITITLDDLERGHFLQGSSESALNMEPLEVIRHTFYAPEPLKPEETTAKLTEDVADLFHDIAVNLREKWHEEDMAVASYVCKLVFCLFASDVGLLPKDIITTIIDQSKSTAPAVARQLSSLFAAMNSGEDWGPYTLNHFNGGLFADPVALVIDSENLGKLREADQKDWADVEPSIFGTLFERIIDQDKRKQLGKHYTSREDIETLIEPVILWPLQKEWDAVAAEVDEVMRPDHTDPVAREKGAALLEGFVYRLAQVRILDPACGSGNFLYIAFEKLKELERAARSRAYTWTIPAPTPRVHPKQLYGIEVNEYAHQLASTVVWIGYLQWKRRNGLLLDDEDPILQPLDNIKLMDAILAQTPAGRWYEPEWPEVDYIVGNPPFLGGNRIRAELGDDYVDGLFELYDERVRPFADLCCYWFEKSRAMVARGRVKRAGLLATQAIRAGASRDVLERIKRSGDIFFAEADRPWVLNGAAVRVSMVGIDDGNETRRQLDGQQVEGINANLTHRLDLTEAQQLPENARLSFMGPSPKGPFDLSPSAAKAMLREPVNVNGRPNVDVVVPLFSGTDITKRWRGKWTIDFGLRSEEEAAMYEKPFEYLVRIVRPIRTRNRRASYAQRWWLYAEPRPGLRTAVADLPRFIVTPAVAKHRVFVWISPPALCNQKTTTFARADDYFFGVLHSRIHELWALATSSRHGVGNDPVYNNTTCFETFPFPWPPGKEPAGSPEVEAIAEAARELDTLRNNWLNPEGMPEDELKLRTLTKLYNEPPTWLDNAHKKLDAAVFAAYDWPDNLSDQDVLARLLALNLERSTT
jgi:type II restriction/modification system DNA methylase subunit YeeA